MEVHVAQPTWAGRVRNYIKNSFEYNKDAEVTSKLTNAKADQMFMNYCRKSSLHEIILKAQKQD